MLKDLLSNVKFLHLACAGYFEARWRSSQWKCSLDTLHEQAAQQDETVTGMLSGRLGAVRLLDLSSSETRNVLERIEWDALRQTCSILLIEHIEGRSRSNELYRTVLSRAPMCQFYGAHFYVRNVVNVT